MHGDRPSYCDLPHVSHLAADYSGHKVINTHCNTMGCPKCGVLWQLQKVFDTTVHLEAYARYSGSRPAWGVGSVRSKNGYTLDDIRKDGRNIKDRLLRQGVVAGYRWFHPDRILNEVKEALRVIIGGECDEEGESEGFWHFLRDDRHEGNLEKINDYLGTNFITLYDCLDFAPHFHVFTFPGRQRFTGDKKGGQVILSKKPVHGKGKTAVYTMDTVREIFMKCMYLISHTGQLDDRKISHIKPVIPFGELYNMSPEQLVSYDVLEDIRKEVLEIMNEGRDVKLVFVDGALQWLRKQESDEPVMIPIGKFRLKSLGAHEFVKAYLKGAKQSKYASNYDYLKYDIDMFNLISDHAPKKWKRLFTEPFTDDRMPEFINELPEHHALRYIFRDGLKPVPEGFRVYGLYERLKTGTLQPKYESKFEGDPLKGLRVRSRYYEGG